MRVSPDGNARFTQQENGQVFADGNEQNTGRFREWQQGYETLYLEQNHFKSRTLENRNTIPKEKVIIEQ